MLRNRFAAVAAVALLSAGIISAPGWQRRAIAHDVTVGPLVLTDLWSRATPPGAATAAGYLTITNRSNQPDRLVSVASPAASATHIHEMRMEGDRMLMRAADDGVPVPGGATVALAPGGFHLMFVGLVAGFSEGSDVPVTLTFETAGAVETTLHVLAIGSRGPAHAAVVEAH